jgi:hypothetical protein
MTRRRYMTGGSAGKTGMPNRPITRGVASPTTITTTIPAPVQGLNAQDNLVDMPATSAITLTNFIVRPFGCETRKGSQQHCTNITGTVNSLLVYNGTTTGSDKIFAAAGTQFYDVTNPSIAPSVVQTGLSTDEWEYTNFTTPGGQYLVAVDGVSAARLWTGSAWITFSQVASPTNPGEVSGADPATFSNVTSHKLRLWFTKTSSLAAYYLPINSVGGAATKFDLGPYMPRGGKLVALDTWSIDGGSGLDDLFVAVSSEGDVAIFKGTDPSNSSTWALVGVWSLAPPVGKKCLTKFGGDLVYLAQDGLELMSKYLQTARLDASTAITNPIQQTISDLLTQFSTLHGWSLTHFPVENVLVLNVPNGYASGSIQYVYNTVTLAWSQFKGWDAKCWAIQNDTAFFGTTGSVVQAFRGWVDGADINGENGNPYQALAQQAFNYFQKPGQKKQFKMVRLTTTSNSIPQVTMGINLDFEFGTAPNSIGNIPVTVVPVVWGGYNWSETTWAKDTQTIQSWQAVRGIGYAAALTVIIDVVGKTTWASSDWVIELAGVI